MLRDRHFLWCQWQATTMQVASWTTTNLSESLGAIPDIWGTQKLLLSKSTHHLEADQEAKYSAYTMFTLPSSKQDPIQITVDAWCWQLCSTNGIGYRGIPFQLSVRRYTRLPSGPKLQSTSAQLRTYTGKPIKVLGCISVTVHHNTQDKCLPSLIVRGEGPSLLGRNWQSWGHYFYKVTSYLLLITFLESKSLQLHITLTEK